MADLNKSAVIVTVDEGAYHEIEMRLRQLGYKRFRWEINNPQNSFSTNPDLLVMVKSTFSNADRHSFKTIQASSKIAVITSRHREQDEALQELGHPVYYESVGIDKPVRFLG